MGVDTKFAPVQLSQLEHILKRPDSYIGSVEHLQAQLWVFDRETKGMTQKTISYVPGFFKIFDEILVNAADNKASQLSAWLVRQDPG